MNTILVERITQVAHKSCPWAKSATGFAAYCLRRADHSHYIAAEGKTHKFRPDVQQVGAITVLILKQ
jgi:hypothetical protein